MGGANARGGGARFKVDLVERHKSSFEQSNQRGLSTPKKDMAKMVDGTPSALVLESITKEK